MVGDKLFNESIINVGRVHCIDVKMLYDEVLEMEYTKLIVCPKHMRNVGK